MTAIEQMYFNRMRQQQVYKAYAERQAFLASKIANIRSAILAGADVFHDKKYVEDLKILFTELGPGVRKMFVFEDNDGKALMKEECHE